MALSTKADTAPPMTPTPTLNSLTIERLSEVIWVIRTPMDHTTRAWSGCRVHSRNIRIVESKPTSMPPSPLSSTIGNFAITTMSGMLSSASFDSSASFETTRKVA
jgi:hypothetical protein